MVKKPPAMQETGLIPESGRSLEKETATHASILARRILWTERPGGLRPWGHKASDTPERLTGSLFRHRYKYRHRCKDRLDFLLFSR